MPTTMASEPAAAPLILPMQRADVSAVCRIADAAFPLPWRRDDFERELVRAWAVIRVLRPHAGAPVAAFVHYWWVSGEVQIMNIATEPGCRRHGHARALMQDVLDAARGRARALILEVRRSNRPAIALYESLGFAGIGVRPRYYANDGEDALVMRRDLPLRASDSPDARDW